MPAPHHNHRSAYTLMELLVATTSAGVLMGGMASALIVASRTLDHQSTGAGQQATLADAMGQMTSDLQHATAFTQRSATAVEFTVPDRSSDGVDETLRYAWSGVAGDPLTLEYNGGPPTVVAEGVTTLGLDYIERDMLAAPPASGRGVRFEGFTEAKQDATVYSITVATPAGTDELDLLIAAVAIHNDEVGSTSAPAGWTLLVEEEHSGGHVTLSVWWKLAHAVEASSHTFGWGNRSDRAYAWIMRFSGHNFSNPIDAFATKTGKYDEPPEPALTPTIDDAFMLRLGAFHNNSVVEDDTGLLSHTHITMDGVSKVSGGAGYRQQSDPNPHSQYEFQLTKKEEYVTATIAIAPDE